jgi:hypothetical protein
MGGASIGRPLSVHDAKRRLLTLGRRQDRLGSRFAAGGWGAWLRLAAAFAGGAVAGKMAGRAIGVARRPTATSADTSSRGASTASRGEQAGASGLIAQIASIALPMLTREVLGALFASQARAAATPKRPAAHDATGAERCSSREGEW